MRITSLSTIEYFPGPVPTNTDDIPRYLIEEFQKISNAVSLLSDGHLEPMPLPPSKPRLGDFRLSDGVNWDPLALGVPKMVWYDGTAWQPF